MTNDRDSLNRITQEIPTVNTRSVATPLCNSEQEPVTCHALSRSSRASLADDRRTDVDRGAPTTAAHQPNQINIAPLLPATLCLPLCFRLSSFPLSFPSSPLLLLPTLFSPACFHLALSPISFSSIFLAVAFSVSYLYLYLCVSMFGLISTMAAGATLAPRDH